MSHVPVNHHLRPVYRVLAVLTGGFLLVFGAVGVSRTRGADWFATGDWSALGLSTNRGFAVLSLLVGAVVVVAALIGRNVDRFVNLYGAFGFMIAGTMMMPLIHTDVNLFNSSMGTAVVSYVIGTLLLVAGLYGKVGPADAVATQAAEH